MKTDNKNIPGIGIDEQGTRIESDSMGEIEVPANHYWGAQTQRSLLHFSIGNDLMPKEVYHAYGIVKKAAALVNQKAGRLPDDKAKAIILAADEVIRKELDSEFPLYVWQTGSGTQSNMNVNEVISNRAIQILGGKLGSKKPVHPNDHVNLGQSSNDTFPTAMHIAAVNMIDDHLLPQLLSLQRTIRNKSRSWEKVIKIGRTHLQDAVPLTVGQEWSGYAEQLEDAIKRVKYSRGNLYRLAAGGTAVGTGLNSPEGFGKDIARAIANLTGKPFITAPNKFAAQGSLDAIVAAMAALRGVAVALMKIANDMRWLASGPRCGLGELLLPANEPGSSIMPGKVNPVMPELMNQICYKAIGNDATVTIASRDGLLQLNAYEPVVAVSIMESQTLFYKTMPLFRANCIDGITVNKNVQENYINRTIGIVTALNPVLGYEKTTELAKEALQSGKGILELIREKKLLTEQQIKDLMDPVKLTTPTGPTNKSE